MKKFKLSMKHANIISPEKEMLIDDSDARFVQVETLRVRNPRQSPCITARINGQVVSLARHIAGLKFKDGKYIHFKNGNRGDLRRENLLVTTSPRLRGTELMVVQETMNNPKKPPYTVEEMVQKVETLSLTNLEKLGTMLAEHKEQVQPTSNV